MNATPKILLIYTGGTIGMIKNHDSGHLEPWDLTQLQQQLPELNRLPCQLKMEAVTQIKDSSDIGPLDWQFLAQLIAQNYTEFDGFVVLHGSDTMSYTASAMSFMLQNLQKPVVFTGSQLPIGDIRTDAKENLITALELASLQKNGVATIGEVVLYFEYKLYRANRTTKLNAEHFNAFVSPNYPLLAEAGVHLEVQEEHLRKPSRDDFQLLDQIDTGVALLKLYPGINPEQIKLLSSIKGLKAVVLETFGSGNIPLAPALHMALSALKSQGIILINCTQCVGGSVEMGRYKTSVFLRELGVLSAGDMTTEATLTKTMHLLAYCHQLSDFSQKFHKSICGERTEKNIFSSY